MEYVNICICNEEDAEKIFGVRAKDSNINSGQLNESDYKNVASKLMEIFDFEKVAITLRESIDASNNRWSGCLWDGKDFLLSKKYDIHLVDRVGGGDAFCAGLIYCFITGKSDRETLDFAVAASCLQQTVHGDLCIVSVNEVEQLLQSGGSGRIQR